MVDDFYFLYCVEGVVICHEGTAALADVTDLDADIPQERTACPTSHDHMTCATRSEERTS